MNESNEEIKKSTCDEVEPRQVDIVDVDEVEDNSKLSLENTSSESRTNPIPAGLYPNINPKDNLSSSVEDSNPVTPTRSPGSTPSPTSTSSTVSVKSLTVAIEKELSNLDNLKETTKTTSSDKEENDDKSSKNVDISSTTKTTAATTTAINNQTRYTKPGDPNNSNLIFHENFPGKTVGIAVALRKKLSVKSPTTISTNLSTSLAETESVSPVKMISPSPQVKAKDKSHHHSPSPKGKPVIGKSGEKTPASSTSNIKVPPPPEKDPHHHQHHHVNKRAKDFESIKTHSNSVKSHLASVGVSGVYAKSPDSPTLVRPKSCLPSFNNNLEELPYTYGSPLYSEWQANPYQLASGYPAYLQHQQIQQQISHQYGYAAGYSSYGGYSPAESYHFYDQLFQQQRLNYEIQQQQQQHQQQQQQQRQLERINIPSPSPTHLSPHNQSHHWASELYHSTLSPKSLTSSTPSPITVSYDSSYGIGGGKRSDTPTATIPYSTPKGIKNVPHSPFSPSIPSKDWKEMRISPAHEEKKISPLTLDGKSPQDSQNPAGGNKHDFKRLESLIERRIDSPQLIIAHDSSSTGHDDSISMVVEDLSQKSKKEMLVVNKRDRHCEKSVPEKTKSMNGLPAITNTNNNNNSKKVPKCTKKVNDTFTNSNSILSPSNKSSDSSGSSTTSSSGSRGISKHPELDSRFEFDEDEEDKIISQRPISCTSNGGKYFSIRRGGGSTSKNDGGPAIVSSKKDINSISTTSSFTSKISLNSNTETSNQNDTSQNRGVRSGISSGTGGDLINDKCSTTKAEPSQLCDNDIINISPSKPSNITSNNSPEHSILNYSDNNNKSFPSSTATTVAAAISQDRKFRLSEESNCDDLDLLASVASEFGTEILLKPRSTFPLGQPQSPVNSTINEENEDDNSEYEFDFDFTSPTALSIRKSKLNNKIVLKIPKVQKRSKGNKGTTLSKKSIKLRKPVDPEKVGIKSKSQRKSKESNGEPGKVSTGRNRAKSVDSILKIEQAIAKAKEELNKEFGITHDKLNRRSSLSRSRNTSGAAATDKLEHSNQDLKKISRKLKKNDEKLNQNFAKKDEKLGKNLMKKDVKLSKNVSPKKIMDFDSDFDLDLDDGKVDERQSIKATKGVKNNHSSISSNSSNLKLADLSVKSSNNVPQKQNAYLAFIKNSHSTSSKPAIKNDKQESVLKLDDQQQHQQQMDYKYSLGLGLDPIQKRKRSFEEIHNSVVEDDWSTNPLVAVQAVLYNKPDEDILRRNSSLSPQKKETKRKLTKPSDLPKNNISSSASALLNNHKKTNQSSSSYSANNKAQDNNICIKDKDPTPITPSKRRRTQSTTDIQHIKPKPTLRAEPTFVKSNSKSSLLQMDDDDDVEELLSLSRSDSDEDTEEDTDFDDSVSVKKNKMKRKASISETSLKTNATTSTSTTLTRSTSSRLSSKRNSICGSGEVENEVIVAKKGDRVTFTNVSEFIDEMRILTEIQGLFYTGKLVALQPPDVYGVTLDNERGAPPHLIFSAEEVLEKCIREMRPGDMICGLRICAYWSPQYKGLYPGRVSADYNPNVIPTSDLIPIEFDDGDTGVIKTGEIRLLDNNHPIRAYDPNPLLTLEKKHRKRRHSSNLSQASCTGDHEEEDCGKSFCAKIEKESINSDEEDNESYSAYKNKKKSSKVLFWTWNGLGYKRPKCKNNRQKEFYRGIQRGDESINVGDSAIFISHENERPFIGRVEKFWEKQGRKVVTVSWYYHPEEVKARKKPTIKYPGALFESAHIDENDVQTIAKSCEVLPFEEYKKRISSSGNGTSTRISISAPKKNPSKARDFYYVAGFYDPFKHDLKLVKDLK